MIHQRFGNSGRGYFWKGFEYNSDGNCMMAKIEAVEHLPSRVVSLSHILKPHVAASLPVAERAMEAALVGVATGVMKPLLSKLSKLLEEEHSKLKGVRRDTRFIRDEMATMSATLQILADEEELDPQVRIWRDNVRELSYDMEDCVDDFMRRVDHESESDGSTRIKAIYDWVKKLKPRHEIAGQIGELKARAVEASERHKRYKIVQPTASSISSIDPRLHALYVEIDKLVGIDGPKQHIIDLFERGTSSSQLKVVSIVGPGGLGKTTLANQVYHSMKGQFSCAAFVSVSRKPDMKNILRQIAKGLGIADVTSDDDVRSVIDKLRDHLQDRRYLVVIDDVWSREAWETISFALLNNNCSSRIITTTRINEVAACSSQGEGRHIYEMKPLSFVDSKRLFFKRVFGSEDLCHPHLEKVSDGILGKCAGLPLAIITVSSLLANQHAEEEWNRVLAAIGSALAKDSNSGNMAKILSLSYFDLPHNLRSCLLYLSVYSEDEIIGKQDLIGKWIAEGFIHEEQGRSTYEIGEGYYIELINRCLIQQVGGHDKLPLFETCRVHDIILDFATCRAAEENFVTSFNSGEHEQKSDYKVRRLRVGSKTDEEVTVPTSLDISHVRSLTVCGSFVQHSLSDFPALRVLDLAKCTELKDDDHLANIGKLFFLKYLRLRESRLRDELPRKIGELQYLETLDITSTVICELPSTITKLQRLARLYLSSYTRFPVGIIGQLQSLEVISFDISEVERGEFLRELNQLKKLRTVIVICAFHYHDIAMEVEDNLGALVSSCSLHDLYIFAVDVRYRLGMSFESWCPTVPCSLRKLHLQYRYIDKVPSWMSLLVNLRELTLNFMKLTPEGVAILGAIPALVYLRVTTLSGSNEKIFVRGFRILKYFYLEISSCRTSLKFEAGSMPKLEHLELNIRVREMECRNNSFGIQHLSALTKVEVNIDVCTEDEDPKADVENSIIKSVTSLIETTVASLPNLPTLSIQCHSEMCNDPGEPIELFESDEADD